MSQRPPAPRSIAPFAFALITVLVTIVAWAVLSVRPLGNDASFAPILPAVPMRSVAFAVAETTGGVTADIVYVQETASGAEPRAVASFPSIFGAVHLRGQASPHGDTLAILWVPAPGADARLSFVDTATGDRKDLQGRFDHTSALAWSPDQLHLAATLSSESGVSVIEVDVTTGTFREVAVFEGARTVVPVGYSPATGGLYVVVVNQAGSALWVTGAEAPQQVATLSPGPTRDWALSADGTRLAYVERLGAGERSYAARLLILATGTIRDVADTGDQLGAAWRPGAAIPDFGGPAGTLQLTAPPESGSYVIPVRWSPDGATLVAAVYTPSRNGVRATESLELVTSETRTRLALEGRPAVAFLGWVRDID